MNDAFTVYDYNLDFDLHKIFMWRHNFAGSVFVFCVNVAGGVAGKSC